jgi:hypothetical protein
MPAGIPRTAGTLAIATCLAATLVIGAPPARTVGITIDIAHDDILDGRDITLRESLAEEDGNSHTRIEMPICPDPSQDHCLGQMLTAMISGHVDIPATHKIELDLLMMSRRPGGDIEYTPFKAGAFILQRATAYELANGWTITISPTTNQSLASLPDPDPSTTRQPP